MSNLIIVAFVFAAAWLVFAGVLWRVNAQDTALEAQAKHFEDKLQA